MDAGTMTFTKGDKRVVSPVQILGTQSEKTNTWLWAWANARSGIPARLISAAKDLRGFGDENKIEEFTKPTWGIDKWDGYAIASVASALLGVPGFHRAPYAGGAMFVLLLAPELKVPLKLPLLRFVMAVPELDYNLIAESTRAVGVFARRLGLKITAADPLEVVSGEGSVKVFFDGKGRFNRLEADLGPAA
jgi:hypothetical protein